MQEVGSLCTILIMPLIGRTVTYLSCLVVLGACGESITSSQGEKTCNPSVVTFNQCGSTEACYRVDDKKGVCGCRKDYEKDNNGVCQLVPKEPNPTPSPNTSSNSDSGGFGFKLILWLIIPVLLAGAIGAIVYTGRQKLWLNRLYRMRVRSYNNVLSTRPV